MKTIVVALTLLAAFVLCASAATTFEGRWTDSFWGDNDSYCCTRPNNKLYCLYAQIGIVEGTVSGNTVTGKFYEGGSNVTPCPTGTFTWTLNEAGDAFTGSYTCNDEHNENNHNWSESRLSSAVPTATECGARTNSRDISGKDDIDTVSVCNGNGAYQSSFVFAANFNGYEEGVTFDSGSIGSGFYYYDNNGVSGIGVSLYFVLEDGTEGNLFRDTAVYGQPPAGFDLATEPDDGTHGYLVSPWVPSNPSNSDCQEFVQIKNDFLAQYSSTSAASSGSSSSGSSSSGSSGSSGASGSSSSASILTVSAAFLSLVAIFAALF